MCETTPTLPPSHFRNRGSGLVQSHSDQGYVAIGVKVDGVQSILHLPVRFIMVEPGYGELVEECSNSTVEVQILRLFLGGDEDEDGGLFLGAQGIRFTGKVRELLQCHGREPNSVENLPQHLPQLSAISESFTPGDLLGPPSDAGVIQLPFTGMHGFHAGDTEQGLLRHREDALVCEDLVRTLADEAHASLRHRVQIGSHTLVQNHADVLDRQFLSEQEFHNLQFQVVQHVFPSRIHDTEAILQRELS